VPNYRIYLMSDDHIHDGFDFECATDEEALAEAQNLLGTHAKAEVWIGTRRVGVEVSPSGPNPLPPDPSSTG
jgi:hypothetical protein